MAAEDPPRISEERADAESGKPSEGTSSEATSSATTRSGGTSALLQWARTKVKRLRPEPGEMVALALALVPALLLAPRIIEKIPLSSDHATHLFKAWHFWTELVARGRLRGWSNYWAFGYPADELVPPGGQIWVGLFHYGSLGTLSWARSYAVAFAALLVLKAYASYRVGRHFFGRTAGVVAALLMTIDRGGMLEGGWHWHTYWGVWPVTLSMSLAALALIRLDRVLRGGSVHDVVLAGLLFAGALLSHALPIAVFPLLVPLLFLDHALRPAPPPPRRFALSLAGPGLGLGLTAFFLIPFFTHTGDTADFGWMHEPLSVVGERLLLGQSFQGQWPWVHFLALGGLVVALLRRPRGGLFCAGTALVCLFLASNTLFRDFHLERAWPMLRKVEVTRFLLVAKLAWFPLAGYAVSELAALGARTRFGENRVLSWLSVIVLGVASAGLLIPGGKKFYDEELSFPVTGRDEMENWHDFEPFLRWSRELRKSTQGFYRIVYKVWRGNHLPTVMPVYNQTPIYKTGITPTLMFSRVPVADDLDLYRALSVKYVVTTAPDASPEFKLVRRFGKLWVYEFRDYRSDPFTLLGAGRGRLLEFSPERIRIELSGTEPGSRLKLHVASFSRWQARERGQTLPISTVTAKDYKYPFLMEVPVTDGELTFEYVRRPADWFGLLVSLATLPAFLGAWLFARRRPELLRRAAAELTRRRRTLWRAALAVLGIVALGIVARTQTRAHLLPDDSLFHRLKGPELSVAGSACERKGALLFRCGNYTLQADSVPSENWGVHLCMTTPTPGPVTLSTELELGSFLSLPYEPPKQGAGRISVALDGQNLASFATAPGWQWHQVVQFDTRERRGQKGALRVTWSGPVVNCFDLRVLDGATNGG